MLHCYRKQVLLYFSWERVLQCSQEKEKEMIKFDGNGKDGYLILEEGETYEVIRNMSFKGIDLSQGGTLKTNGFDVSVAEYIFLPEKGRTGGIQP